jgi:cytochrome d ubiquinol oxidase subunit II
MVRRRKSSDFLPVPILVVALVTATLGSLHLKFERVPFLLTVGVMFLGFTGLIISIFPNVVPPSLDIWAASSPPSSQRMTLIGISIVLPIVMVYSVFA